MTATLPTVNVPVPGKNSGKYDAMSSVPAWFERKFDFSFPVELYRNVCVRLLGTPARVEEMLSGVSHQVLTNKAQATWSMQEHAGHLADMEPLWKARVN